MENQETTPPNITATNVQPAAAQKFDPTGGVKDGTVEKRDHPQEQVRNVIEHFEQVVVEKDEEGNSVGFHKVPVEQEAQNNG
jgi:hypothetical protein